jgi:hypothetical protein
MMQVVQQTREERVKMYMKLSKRQLVEYLILCKDELKMISNPVYSKKSVTTSATANKDGNPVKPNRAYDLSSIKTR